MEKTKFLYGALGLLALGMTACSSEEPAGNGVAQQDENRYLRVNLVNPAGTRADEKFEAGTAEENAVNSIIMDFYDAAGNFVTRANPSDINWTDNTNEDGSIPSVGRIASAVVKIGIEKEQNLPSYVMCYLNPVEWGDSDMKGTNMSSLRNVTRPAYKDGNNHFAMNNSCYYGNDAITGQSNVKISGTPIVAEMLYTSEAEAEDKDAATVDIYVERYAAKVTFTAETTVQTDAYTEGGKGVYAYTGSTIVGDETIDYSLAFIAEKWTINADAPDMFAVKNFTTVLGTPVATIDQVNSYLGGWRTWNDADNYRSYWSCSPAFFSSEFPQVSDQIADIAHEDSDIPENGQGVKVGPYELKYYSYKQICGEDGNGEGFEIKEGALPHKYALENTVGKPAFASLNPKAAVPSVLMVGGYKVTYGNQDIPKNTSFYIFNNSLYFKEQLDGVDKVVLMKDKFIAQQQILYVVTKVDKEGNPEEYNYLKSDNATAVLNDLEVKHPDKDVRGNNLVPQRFVTLQLTGVPTGAKVYYHPTGSSEFVEVTDDNLNVVNTLLWQQSGVAYAYTQGKCYFSMPIWHLGMTENKENSPISEDGVLDWKKLRVGDMGLVRNHVYKLHVDAITGLATGIENLDYPIVPPMDQDEYYIKYRINILNWRVVPEQGGIILK